MSVVLVGLYLVAIVAANLLAAAYGQAHPEVIIFNGLVLIGLDLTTRDALHDRWQGRRLPLRMAGLIAAGSLASWALNHDAGRVALASALAFGIAATADWAVYQLAHRRPWLVRVNASNLAGAALDSLVFPLVAFGGLNWRLTAGLFAAKVVGGAGWAWLLSRTRPRHAPATD